MQPQMVSGCGGGMRDGPRKGVRVWRQRTLAGWRPKGCQDGGTILRDGGPKGVRAPMIGSDLSMGRNNMLFTRVRGRLVLPPRRPPARY